LPALHNGAILNTFRTERLPTYTTLPGINSWTQNKVKNAVHNALATSQWSNR
jgi:hypothetical protein